eukprot:1140332-Pelagomonas_calceolata.AAC.12
MDSAEQYEQLHHFAVITSQCVGTTKQGQGSKAVYMVENMTAGPRPKKLHLRGGGYGLQGLHPGQHCQVGVGGLLRPRLNHLQTLVRVTGASPHPVGRIESLRCHVMCGTTSVCIPQSF